MKRTFLVVALLTLSSLTEPCCSSCGSDSELPLTLYVDGRCSADERSMIDGAVNEWNANAGRRYKHGDSVFVMADRLTVSAEQPLRCDGNRNIIMCGGITMFMANAAVGDDSTCFSVSPSDANVRTRTLQFLGHMMGIPNARNHSGVMSPSSVNGSSSPDELTYSDMNLFCAFYECH